MSSKANSNFDSKSSPADGSMQLEPFQEETEFLSFPDVKEPNEVNEKKQGGRSFLPSAKRFKSMLRAGMLTAQKDKVKIVHDGHKHDKYMLHPLSRFK